MREESASHALLSVQLVRHIMIAQVVLVKLHFTTLSLLMVKEFANQYAESDAKNVMFLMDVSHQMMGNVLISTEYLQIAVLIARFALPQDAANAKNVKQTIS